MATLRALLDRFCDLSLADTGPILVSIGELVPSATPFVDLLRDYLGPYLTSSDGKVRTRATQLLSSLLQRGGAGLFHAATESDAKQSAKALLDFFCGRLADYPR